MSPDNDRALLTGISGFIAKHVAMALLAAGFGVRGTVRSLAKAERVSAGLSAAGADVSRLEFVEADLMRDAGWDAAVSGCRFVVHTASPFPSAPPKDKFGLVPAAEGGTLRVIDAAKRAGVERLVLTSSVVAVYHGHGDRAGRRFTEADFSNVESPDIFSYAVSKTMAERAAWRAVEDGALQLAVINPALVLGPLLDAGHGTSIGVIAAMMRGRLPVVPAARFGVVDVRDVAAAHVAAMVRPEAAGRRFIVSGEAMTLREIGAAIGRHHPAFGRRLPRFTLPSAIVQLAARVSGRAAMLAAELDPGRELDNSAARDVLGIGFRDGEAAVEASAESLLRFGVVRAPRA